MNKSRIFSLLFALLLTAALFGYVVLGTHPRYENSDDMLIVKSFMGFEGGQVSSFSFYLHPLLVGALGLVSRIFPGKPWFSLLQLGCLFVSLTFLGYAMARSARSRWIGGFAAILATLIFGLFAVGRVQYTTTAALMGTAACALMMCAAMPRGKGSAMMSRLASCGLMAAVYLFRPEVFEPLLPFWLLSYLWSVNRAGREHREALGKENAGKGWLSRAIRDFVLGLKAQKALLFKILCGFGAVMAALLLWRVMSFSTPELQEYYHYMNASNELMDYHEDALKNATEETLAKVGWSEAERQLVVQSFFMDENINTETLTAIVEAEPSRPLMEHLQSALSGIGDFLQRNPRDALLLAAAVLLCGMALLLCRRGVDRATALCALLGALLMIFYLGWRGRVLGRAVECALFPAIAIPAQLMLCNTGSVLRRAVAQAAPAFQPLPLWRRVAAGLLAIGLLSVSAVYTRTTVGLLRAHPDSVSQQREDDLEHYALSHPDTLIMRTPDLLRDTRLLPTAPDGVPGNIILWGDWYCRTPNWYAQLEKYGFDGRHFTPADYLRDTLRFASEGEVPEALLTYLSEGLETPVRAVLTDTCGTLNFYRFEADIAQKEETP